MDLHSRPSGPLQGTVAAPPSKSITHRAIILASLGEGRSRIRNPLLSGDTRSTLKAASLMGAVHREGEVLTIDPDLHQATDVINADNSGTTARLFSSVCALLPGYAVITGDESLRSRPMEPIIRAVRQLGGKAFSTEGNGHLPAVFGGRMYRDHASLQGDISSQFASSLAISCPLKEDDTEIRLTGSIQSQAYLRLTTEMVEMFGCRSVLDGSTLYCTGGSNYRGRSVTIPGDFSSASFLLAAAALTGGEVEVKGLHNGLTQADSRIVDVLELYGCRVKSRAGSVSVSQGTLEGTAVDCTSSPDLFPVVCILAAGAKGRSVVKGNKNLRFKETDRIRTTCEMLKSLGIRSRADGETLTIDGGSIRGGHVESHGDHRIVMASCIAGLASVSPEGCTVTDGHAYSVSYPSFVRDITSLGGRVEVS